MKPPAHFPGGGGLHFHWPLDKEQGSGCYFPAGAGAPSASWLMVLRSLRRRR